MPHATTPILGALGDLVEDIRVLLATPINVATDTDARIHRTRGGSAANVAVAAAAVEGRARFIGLVADDPIGAAMTTELATAGVETTGRRGGRTGTIVVLAEPGGERTMLTDRGSAHALTDPEPSWLDGLHTLHVPAYSLAVEPLATTAGTLVGWAHERAITVSVDLSSTSVLASYGEAAFAARLTALAPAVVLGNEDEAARMGRHLEPVAATGATIVIHGATAASARDGGRVVAVGVEPVAGLRDTTGAGDAFAAGYLCARAAGGGPTDALAAGHRAARAHLTASRAPR